MERTSKRVKTHNHIIEKDNNSKSNELILLNNLELKINKIGNICMTLITNINSIKLQQNLLITQQNLLITQQNNITNKIKSTEDSLKVIGIEIKEKSTTPISNDMLNAYG